MQKAWHQISNVWVYSPLGPVVAVEEDIRIRKSQEGEWRLVSRW
mgnify:CR=1 FL=1